MNLNYNIGLRGKLSIIILFAVIALSVVLNLTTSNYLANIVSQEYIKRAETIAGYLQANMTASNDGNVATHMQSELDALRENNPDIHRITVYGPDGSNNIKVIASTEKELIGAPAHAEDIQAIHSNSPVTTEKTEGKPGEVPDAGSPIKSDKVMELLSPLHDAAGLPVASVGIYMESAPRDSLIRTQQINFAIITNLGLLILVLILYLSLNKMIVKPVKLLTRATRHIGQPEWDTPAISVRHDEIGNLTNAFNDIADSLTARDEEVKLLLDASVAVSSALHVDKILQILCERIAASKMVTYCRISLLDQTRTSLVVKAASLTRESSEWEGGVGHRIDLAEAGHHAHVMESGKPTILRKNGQLSVEGSETEWEWALTADTRSALLLPLVSKEETIGIVTLGEVRRWDRTPFSAKKIEFYQTLMNQAAVAIENAKLYEKTEWQVSELSTMHNMSQEFTSTLDYQEVVSVVANRVGTLIGAQFASVLLPDNQNRYLNIMASYNLSAEYIWTVNKKRRIPVGVGPVGKAFSSRRSQAVNNVITDPDYGLWKHLAANQGYSSLIALPLIAKGQSIGVICMYFAEPRQLKKDEIDLMVTSANEAAIAIENARIYENLQDAFVGTIRSLAETIDAKDAYTRGHSERVSLYAEAIARGLNLQGNELQTIRYAGYLHDVGKIGIPDAILSKPGKLTMEEFRVIKKHPVLSERILKPVSFPFPVQSIVRHHHERYDGNGYPDGLAGEEIPLGARILFVADAYEAMTSDRPYRQALSTQTALDELEKNKTSQFDPRVVDAFHKIIKMENTAEQNNLRLEA
ncbi:MAG: HD domain-containing phosphohydrolase [Thermoleophilia bacterium]